MPCCGRSAPIRSCARPSWRCWCSNRRPTGRRCGRAIASLTESVPRLRSRAVNRPGRGRPQFVPDKTFDLDVHLRRMRLPDHGRAASGPRPGADDGDHWVRPGVAALGGRARRGHGRGLRRPRHEGSPLGHRRCGRPHRPGPPLRHTRGRAPRAPRPENVPDAERGKASPLARLGDLPDAVRLVDDAMDALTAPVPLVRPAGRGWARRWPGSWPRPASRSLRS